MTFNCARKSVTADPKSSAFVTEEVTRSAGSMDSTRRGINRKAGHSSSNDNHDSRCSTKSSTVSGNRVISDEYLIGAHRSRNISGEQIDLALLHGERGKTRN
jgi:hypothetical protein